MAQDPNAGTKRGIPYYIAALDNFAREFAEQMNKLNNTQLPGAGNLFSNSGNGDDATGITASNISISKGWTEGTVSMQTTADKNASSDDRTRLAEFLNLFSKDYEFETGAGTIGEATPYKGSFEDMLLHIQSTLAEDQMATTTVLNNYAITADSIGSDRESVSGVDLNDEATSLMVYQKAYTAACRVMTAMEQVLDTLINEMLI